MNTVSRSEGLNYNKAVRNVDVNFKLAHESYDVLPGDSYFMADVKVLYWNTSHLVFVPPDILEILHHY